MPGGQKHHDGFFKRMVSGGGWWQWTTCLLQRESQEICQHDRNGLPGVLPAAASLLLTCGHCFSMSTKIQHKYFTLYNAKNVCRNNVTKQTLDMQSVGCADPADPLLKSCSLADPAGCVAKLYPGRPGRVHFCRGTVISLQVLY